MHAFLQKLRLLQYPAFLSVIPIIFPLHFSPVKTTLYFRYSIPKLAITTPIPTITIEPSPLILQNNGF